MLPLAAADASVWRDLLSVALYGLGAGVGIAIVFSIALRGLITASTARRAGATGSAVVWGGIGVISLAVCVGAVGIGIVTMLHR